MDYTEELYHIVQVTRYASEDISDHCHLEDKNLLTLCGGIPDNNLTTLELIINVEAPCVYEVEVHTETYYVSRNINLAERTIVNNSMLVPTIYRRNRIGTTLFYNQLVAARQQNIHSLRINAIRGTDLHGYVTWGKMGYTMRPVEIPRFEKLCQQHGLASQSLCDLLKDKAGYDFWIEHGFGWSGEFSLSTASENLRQFKEYLHKRNLIPLPF